MKKESRQFVIYSRKSKFTGKGESIENQIELCRQYIAVHYSQEEADGALVYEVLAPGTHSHFESGKFSQFWPEPGTNPAQWVRLKTPFRVHPKQPN